MKDMITREETFRKAFELKKNELAEKERKRSILLNAAYASQEKLKRIDAELSALGASLAINTLAAGESAVNDIKKRSAALSAEKKLILEKAGVEDIAFDCPVCRDTGYVNGKICGCVKKLAAAVTVKELSAEMPIEDCRFDNFDLSYYPDIEDSDGCNPRRRMTSVLNFCREYVSSFDPKTSDNLMFTGSTGLGKTHLSLAVIYGVVEKGCIPVYGPAENLFSQIENERFKGENRGAYEAMTGCDLLVIDDLGAELDTKFSKSALYNLLNTRLLAGRPTVINTNLTMKEIEERYTPRISSRIIGGFKTFKFIGADIRQQKAIKG